MGSDMTAFIEYDEEYADQQFMMRLRPESPDSLRDLPPPFGSDVTIESLTESGRGLYTGSKDYTFFGAISGQRNKTDIEPLYPPRGVPAFLSWRVKDSVKAGVFDGLYGVGWLTLGEISAALDHQGVDRDHLSNQTLAILDIMGVLEKRFGRDRVRLIFGID
jgi:hypothetical protein